MDIIFVRHGQPAWSVDGITQGDPVLTARGHEQAGHTATHLAALDPPLTEILVSPATRARETAAPLVGATGLNPTVIDGLEEIHIFDPASLAGMQENEVWDRYNQSRSRPPEEWWNGQPGGESFRSFHARVTATLTATLGERGLHADGRDHLWHVAEPDHRIAIVAHGGTNAVGLGWLLGIRPAPWEWERFVLGHCSLAVLQSIEVAGAHAFSLRTSNDLEHLPTELRTR